MTVTVTNDVMVYKPSHLSASQLTLYALCPLLYRERYVLNIFPPPQPERLFGIAVHKGLEALFNGQDEDRAFLKTWREFVSDFPRQTFPSIDLLRARGLDVIAQVRALGLHGTPEYHIVLTHPDFIIPFFGYADLWTPPPDATIIDFKTSGFAWNQARADHQLFQPALYSQAFLETHGQLPRFQFVVLPRVPTPVQVIDATRTPEQIASAFDKAFDIHVAIENQLWDCSCGGRFHLFDPDYEDHDA